ncbi:MAG: gamma-glutamyltransferase [Leptospiraceae bacterium]|nr:gamma-glutamyltransferase [Leptospiraceae bacterium]
MVAAANPLAARAGVAILEKGGNAIDALLAVQWVLNVVEPQASGIGGGAFILYYDHHSRRVHALDGREESPRSTDPRMFLDAQGQPVRFYPDRVSGGLPVGVPGTVAVMHYAWQHFGSRTIPFQDTFDAAIPLARHGFRISPRLALAIQSNQARLERTAASRSVFLPGGRVPAVGEVLRQTDLADTMELIAHSGPAVFYQGEIGDDVVRTVHANRISRGHLSKQDLMNYRAVSRSVLMGRFRGHSIYTMPSPSSAVTVLQSLALLDRFSDADLLQTTANGIHLKLEAEKLAFADRALYLADRDFQNVNERALIAPSYTRQRSRLIQKSRALPAPAKAGQVPGIESYLTSEAPDRREGQHTSHIAIVDQHGNAVSCTTTIEMGFGSALTVPGRGFVLNNELTDFDPELYRANSLESGWRKRRSAVGKNENEQLGGKRPRSSMSPIIVLDGKGQLRYVLGSPGGSRIIGVVSAVLLRLLVDRMDMQSAINAPRALHRHSDQAEMEYILLRQQGLRRQLESRGHSFKSISPLNHVYGGVQGIHVLEDGSLEGGADLRREGAAIAVEEML